MAQITARRALVGMTAAMSLCTGLAVGPTWSAAHADPTSRTFTGTADNDTSTAAARTVVHAITVSEAGTITASLGWSGTADLDLLLKNPAGAAVVSKKTRSGTGPEELTFDAPAAGTYKFNVIAQTGGSAYSLDTTYPGAPVVVRPEDSDPTDTFSGSLSATGTKTASHPITLNAAGTISATLDWADPAAKLSFTLKKPDGTAQVGTGTKPKFITFAAPAAGTYRLNVTAGSGSTAYTVKVNYPKATGGGGGGGGIASYDATFGF